MWLVMIQVDRYAFSNGRAAEVDLSPNLDHLCSDSKQQEDKTGNGIRKKMKVCEHTVNFFSIEFQKKVYNVAVFKKYNVRKGNRTCEK